jgi:FixJ family two-component response regulator
MNNDQTVFVVDDEPLVLRALTRLLRAEGFRAESFGSARQFIDQYNPDVSGCLVIDISMPGITGLQLQQWLVSSGIPLPIIFLTGRDDCSQREEALRWGAVDVLMKPVTAEHLVGCIKEALVQHGKGGTPQQSPGFFPFEPREPIETKDMPTGIKHGDSFAFTNDSTRKQSSSASS